MLGFTEPTLKIGAYGNCPVDEPTTAARAILFGQWLPKKVLTQTGAWMLPPSML